MKRFLLFSLLAVLFLVGAVLSSAPAVQAAQPTPTSPMEPRLDRLKQPPTVYPPTQADEGAQVFYQVCMVCHGDRGQGLTDEWRTALDPADQNCWQSGCHGNKHPPEGFILPRFAPRIIGVGTLARFQTALDLHDYLRASMPWQKPGWLTPEQYWQLTAFLLRANQVEIGPHPLNEGNAARIFVSPVAQPQVDPSPYLAWGAAVVAIIIIIGVSLFIFSHRR